MLGSNNNDQAVIGSGPKRVASQNHRAGRCSATGVGINQREKPGRVLASTFSEPGATGL